MTTSLDDIIKNKRLHEGVAMLASFYARRLMEDQYDRLMNTPTAEKLKQLNRPTKLGIEAAMNMIAAYLVTKEGSLADKPWKKFIFEVLMDAPPEINKRLLNGRSHKDVDGETSMPEDQRALLAAFRELDPNTAKILIEWLQTAKHEDRTKLTEYLSSLISANGHQPDRVIERDVTLADSTSNTRATATRETPGLLAALANEVSQLNSKIEQRKKSTMEGQQP